MTGNAARIKTLQVGLSHLLGSELCLKLMENQLLEESTSEPQGYQEEADKLMTILVSRLNFFLMNLVKGIAQSKKGWVELMFLEKFLFYEIFCTF